MIIFVFTSSDKQFFWNEHTLCKPKPERISQISTWNPTANARKTAIAFLYSDQVQKLVPKISVLDIQFLDNLSADIVIFHTDYPAKAHMQAIASVTKRQVIFYNVDDAFTSFPKGFDPYLEEPNWMKRGKWNYQHMCRFWFKLIMDIPLVLEYKYVMRLDDDSKIIGAWDNIFDLMGKRNAVYFGNVEEADSENGLPGLMKLKTFTINYTESYQVIPKNPKRLIRAFDIPNHIRLYNTNFDVIKVDFFRRSEIRHWTDAVDATHGIFKYRWGDHVLRYLTTALFATPVEVLLRTDFNLPYCHPC
ncbi:unnamed protein product [Rotaria magnacalcarata]|uniref:Uncharacterized protein n=3 Tax=Rotaria magnacalcarata TaxID=392030 RepID=A0A819RA45_9BILA|nr:unnamed protein product [Rotaria magnacalcarata]CAF2245774.1 unnamed protein product [Rotaria magnacalcarata]CAF4036202.1 unnamed protein product [Rotaria magnacalcarata]CAF4186274.1 unnamed protein product [Rotaria magnacalcarata]